MLKKLGNLKRHFFTIVIFFKLTFLIHCLQDSDLPDMVDVDYAKKCPAPTINIKDEADPTLILTLDPKKGAENVRDMAQHLVDHVCVICTQQFQTTEDLKKHFWDHDENIGQVGCLFCKVAFPTKEDLVDHIMGGCNTWGDATPEPKTAARPVGPAALLGTSLLFQVLQTIR